MADTRTPEQRRRIMQSVRTKDTGPEMIVRRLLHGMGYRYRLHRKGLPGSPDIVLPGRRKAIFIHGCFWHGHNCQKGRLPKSRIDYWLPKIERNKERDISATERLQTDGWDVLTIWQCEIADKTALETKLRNFLGSSPKSDRQSA